MKISVITAVFNSANTIGDALLSVREQDFPEIEHVVVDGASTDGTLQVIESHRRSIQKMVSEPDNGIYDALNKGIRYSTGDVVGFLHSDDLFATRHSLSLVAEAFMDPTVGAVYGDLVYVKKIDTSKVVRHWKAGAYNHNRLMNGWMPPHPTFYLRRHLYESLGLFNTNFRIAADYESILRILGRGGVHAAYIPEVLVKMRMGGTSNRSIRNIVMKTREDYAAMQLNDIGGIRALLLKNMIKLPQFVLK